MSVARPELLAAIPVVVALLALGLVLRWRRLRRLAAAMGGAAAERMLPADVLLFPRAALACLAVAGLALCLAAAGPGERPLRGGAASEPLDIAVVVDASISMGAADVEPSRIARARALVTHLAEASPKGRLGIVVAGDWPYTLVPPTDDHDLFGYFGRALDGKLVADLATAVRTATGDRGTSVKAAIEQARAALATRRDRKARRVILLVSDGAIPGDDKEAVAAAAAAAKAGIAVWSAGVGTSGGIPLELGGRPILDPGGDPVMAEFNPKLLRAIAQAGGGTYQDIGSDAGIRALVSGLRGVGGLASAEDAAPQRLTFALAMLALLLLAADGALHAGRLVALRRWIGPAA